MIISTTALLALIVGAIIGLSEAVWAGHLEIGLFLRLNAVTLMVLLTVAGVSFLSSCIFNDTKLSLAFGAGIPILFVFFKMVGDVSERVEFFKYFTLYTVLDTDKILAGDGYALTVVLILLGACAVLYSLGVLIFNKNN